MLLNEEVHIPVSTTIRLRDIKFCRTQGGPQDMIRLRDIKFYRTQGGPQERELRTETASGEEVRGGRSKLHFLGEDMHNAILAAFDAQADEEHDAEVDAEPDADDEGPGAATAEAGGGEPGGGEAGEMGGEEGCSSEASGSGLGAGMGVGAQEAVEQRAVLPEPFVYVRPRRARRARERLVER